MGEIWQERMLAGGVARVVRGEDPDQRQDRTEKGSKHIVRGERRQEEEEMEEEEERRGGETERRRRRRGGGGYDGCHDKIEAVVHVLTIHMPMVRNGNPQTAFIEE